MKIISTVLKLRFGNLFKNNHGFFYNNEDPISKIIFWEYHLKYYISTVLSQLIYVQKPIYLIFII